MSYPKHKETRGIFDIELTFEDEHISPVDCFGADYEGIDEICFRVNHGLDEWVVAKVTASIKGIELCEAYLGCNLYKCGALLNFIKDGYYEDMVLEVIEEAQARVNEIVRIAA